jgi:hypothetical protein
MTRFLLTLTLFNLLALPYAAAQERPLPYPVTPPFEWSSAIQNGTRTTSGEPGPKYWQQWTDYVIQARLDPAAKRLRGTARIVYHNRSPDRLPTVFVHLLQNIHDSGAVRNESQEVTGGMEVRRVTANRQLVPERPPRGPGYYVNGTVMGIRLPSPLASRDSVQLEIEWTFTVPQSGAGRMGWSGDNLFFIAYWYPQMAVYDDVVGWQLDQYLGNAEFYSGFGSYDVTIEAPPGWVVRGTGELMNATQVFPDAVRERLARAMQTDTVVHVLTAQDFGAGQSTREASNGWLAWRFSADKVRDFAFSATTESLWDATRTPVGDRNGDGAIDYTRIEALYRATAPRWRQAWRYGQHAIDFLSKWTGFPYPWPHMTAVEGAGIIGGGMEFPMMTLIGDYSQSTDSALYYVTAHELAHMWVPMIVSNDEKRRAWMDEGTTSFNENQARKEFFPGIDHDEPDRQDYLQAARLGQEGEMMRWSDTTRGPPTRWPHTASRRRCWPCSASCSAIACSERRSRNSSTIGRTGIRRRGTCSTPSTRRPAGTWAGSGGVGITRLGFWIRL